LYGIRSTHNLNPPTDYHHYSSPDHDNDPTAPYHDHYATPQPDTAPRLHHQREDRGDQVQALIALDRDCKEK